jgi:mRNA-degrading endonuclease RelE of RelBE toxin-antitoxin system
MMQRWVVVLERSAVKDLRKLPREVVEILDQLRHDLEAEGPVPKGWTVKHVLGRPGVYAAKLKREYRALYEVVSPTIIIISVSHRKESY